MSLLAWRKLRRKLAAAIHRLEDRKRLNSIKDAFFGEELFILGNGPSLQDIAIDELPRQSKNFMTVNLGYRLFENTMIPFHTVSDISCFERYGREIEAASIEMRFYRAGFRSTATPRQSTVFVPYRRGGVLKKGVQVRAADGIGNDSSVLVFSCQLALHLGFSTVFILGCDLDYSSPNPYAFAMTDEDRHHECSREVQANRRALVNINDEFAALLGAFERRGRRLINCGEGGNLHALPRMRFRDALSRRIGGEDFPKPFLRSSQ